MDSVDMALSKVSMEGQPRQIYIMELAKGQQYSSEDLQNVERYGTDQTGCVAICYFFLL